MNILAIDPGKHGCGVACFEDSALVTGQFIHLPIPPAPALPYEGPGAGVALAMAIEGLVFSGGFAPDVVVVETMRVYTTGKARPSDLMHLQGIAYAIAARYPKAKHVGVDAATWKGTVPREIMGNRIASKMVVLGWKDRIKIPSRVTYLNDIHAAVGIGMWYLKFR